MEYISFEQAQCTAVNLPVIMQKYEQNNGRLLYSNNDN